MQSSFNQIVRQQLILKGLGFYSGKIDGLWGPMTIAAKKRFEQDPLFKPGLPNGGLPLSSSKPWPMGIERSPGTDLLYHPCLDALVKEEQDALSKLARVNSEESLVVSSEE